MKKTLEEQKERIFEIMSQTSLQHSGGGYGPSNEPQKKSTEEKKNETLGNLEHYLLQLSYIITNPEELRTIVNGLLDDMTEQQGSDAKDLGIIPPPSHGTGYPRSTEEEYNNQYDKNMSQGFKNEVKEGNAFIAAANKAKEAGKDTFEMGGKTYDVKK